MKVIVTCGPSYEPIDQVRRLTNFSTGELGVHLSNQLARAGFEVFCLKGSGATHAGPGEQCHLSLFDTNDDLAVSDASPARGLHALTIHPVKSPAREFKFPNYHRIVRDLWKDSERMVGNLPETLQRSHRLGSRRLELLSAARVQRACSPTVLPRV